MTSKPYFATLTDDRELAREVWDKVSDFYSNLFKLPYYRRALESWRTVNGLPTPDEAFENTEIFTTSDNGVLNNIKINQYAAIAQSLVAMTTSTRPDVQVMPTNTDVSSSQASLLGQDLAEYYFKSKGIERAMAEATESAVQMQDGYTLLTWNPTAGGQVEVEGAPLTDPDSGVPYYNGDVEVRSLTPFDVPLDLKWRGTGERPWIITREFVSKAELIAQNPLHEDAINQKAVTNSPECRWPMVYGTLSSRTNDEQVAVFTLWHRKTKAVPAGLQVTFIDERTVLFRGGLPYGDHLPVHRLSAGFQLGTTYGRSSLINLLALNKGLDVAFSVMLTNLSMWGPGSLTTPKGTGLNVSDLGGGAKVLEYDPPPAAPDAHPQALQVPMTSSSTFQLTGLITQTMESISGANASVRGQAPVEFSGAAQALQVEMARQFTGDLQASYVSHYESLSNSLLRILKTYAKSPRTAQIIGKNKSYMLKSWQASDLSGADNITCSISSSVASTAAGRLQIGSDLLGKGLITAPQYLEILRTGALEAETDPSELETLRIREENELLAQGINPPVLFTDDHAEDIRWHLSVLASQQARANPAVQGAVFAHVSEHRWYQAQNVATQPVQAPVGAMPPGPPPPSPSGAPLLPSGPSPAKVLSAAPGAAVAGLPRMPSMPKSPETGQPFQP